MTRKLLFVVVALATAVAVALAAGPKTIYVQVQQSSLRASPSSLASVVTAVKLNDPLTVIEDRDAWKQVSTSDGKTGWISKAAVSDKKSKMSAGGEDLTGGVAMNEQAGAAKGFTSDIEKQFRNKNKDVDFSWVDKMGAMKVTPEEMKDFLKQGKVDASQKGGAK
jgi:SH3-like domain-containing protein